MLIYVEKTIDIICKKHGKQVAPYKTYKNRKKGKLNICPFCNPYTYLWKLLQKYSDNLKKLWYEIIDFNDETKEILFKNTITDEKFLLLKDSFFWRFEKWIKLESSLSNEDKFIDEYKDKLNEFWLKFIEYVKWEGLKLHCEEHWEIIVNKHLISHRLKIQNITPCPQCITFDLLPNLRDKYADKLKELWYEIINYTTEKQIVTLKNLKDDNIFDLRYFTFKNRLDKNNIELDTPTELWELFIQRYWEEFKKHWLEILLDKTIKCSKHWIITETPSYKFMTDRIRLWVSPCIKCHPFLKKQKSWMEKKLVDFIRDIYNWIIISGDRKILGNKQEIDILLPDDNIWIEMNWIYLHNEEQTSKTYHKEKSDLAKTKWIFLYHFFEDEFKKSMYFLFNNLKISENLDINEINKKHNLNISNIWKIFARNTKILEINKKLAGYFLDEYHLQWKDYGVYKCIGLYSDTNELISVMTFKKWDASKNIKTLEWEFELSRYCVKWWVKIIWWFEKMVSFFIKSEPTIKKIYTYSNWRYSNVENNVYLRSDFTLIWFTGIDYFYVFNWIRHSRFAFKKKKLYELLKKYNLDYNKNTGEDLYFFAKKQWIRINRIFGVWNYKWVKNISV